MAITDEEIMRTIIEKIDLDQEVCQQPFVFGLLYRSFM